MKNLLADILENLMETKSIDDVRVVEILEIAHISKPTFYHHFKDKYDLMEFCFMRMYGETFEMMNVYYPFSQACLDLYARYRNKKRFLQNAFASSDVNGLMEIMRRHVRATYVHYLAIQGVPDEGIYAFCLDLTTIGGCELTRRWIERGMDIPDAQLTQMWIDSMPAKIAPYFK